MTENGHPSACSLPKGPRRAALGQAKAGNLEVPELSPTAPQGVSGNWIQSLEARPRNSVDHGRQQ